MEVGEEARVEIGVFAGNEERKGQNSGTSGFAYNEDTPLIEDFTNLSHDLGSLGSKKEWTSDYM